MGFRTPCIDDECADCGACQPVCPVEAIYPEEHLPGERTPYLADNEAFVTEALPGRDGPWGSPGWAARIGPLGVDTPLVATQLRVDETKGA